MINEGVAIFNSTVLKETKNTEHGRPHVLTDAVGSVNCADKDSDVDKLCLHFRSLSDLAGLLSKMCRSHITQNFRSDMVAMNPRFADFAMLTEQELRRQEIERKTGVPPYK